MIGIMGQNAPSSNFAYVTKLGEVAGTSEGCATIQRDLNRLKWADRNAMQFSKEKWKVVHLAGITPGISIC